MSQAQKKILGIVKEMIEEYGLQAVSKPQYANTGTIGVEEAGKFGQHATVSYQFNDGNFTLTIYKTVNGKSVGVPSQPPRQGYFDHYLDYTDSIGFQRFQSIFRSTLEAAQPPRKRLTRRSEAAPKLSGAAPAAAKTVAKARGVVEELLALVKEMAPNFEPREGEETTFAGEIANAEAFLRDTE